MLHLYQENYTNFHGGLGSLYTLMLVLHYWFYFYYCFAVQSLTMWQSDSISIQPVKKLL